MNTVTVIRFGTLVYLGLGILYHLITSDISFTWADPWLYVTMAIWPVFLLGWFLLLVAIVFCLFVGFVWYEEHTKPRISPRLSMRNKRDKNIRDNKRHEEWQEREERRRAAAKATPSQSD